MSLPPLKVKIGADTEGLTTGLGKANKSLKGMGATADSVSRKVQNIATRARALGAAMAKIAAGVAAVTGGLFLMTKASAQNANQIAKAAQTAGVSAEAFQEAAFAVGQMSDVTDQQFGMALQRLNRRMGLAAEGNKTYATALDGIGVSQEDIASGAVTTEEAFARLVGRMESMESAAAAASMASALLGDEVGPKIGAALQANAGQFEENTKRARELGVVMSNDFVRQSEKMVDQLDVLSRQWEVLRADLAEKLVPLFVDQIIPLISDKIVPAMGNWVEKIGEVIEWFQGLPGPVQEALGLIASALAVGGPVMVALGAFLGVLKAALLATGPIGMFIAAAGLLTAAWMKWGDDFKEAVGGAIDWVAEKFDAFKAKIQAIIDKAVEVKDAIANALTFGGGSGVNPESPIAGPRGPMGMSPNQRAAQGGQGNDMPGVGQNAATGMVAGFGQGIADNEEALREYIRNVPRIANEELEIESPSKVFRRIGEFIGQGLSGGIADTASLTERAVRAHTDVAENSAWDTADSVIGAMSSLFKRSKPLAAAQAAVNIGQGITEALKLPFPASLAAAAKVAAQGAAALKQITSASPSGGGGGSAGGAAAAPAGPQIFIDVQPNARGDIPMETFRGAIDNINRALDRGGRIVAG